jgi:type 1 glutamine amidotransferase
MKSIRILLLAGLLGMPPLTSDVQSNMQNNQNARLKILVVHVAWSKTYGKGRVFYATLGHAPESWDNPQIQKMYFEALKWAMGLSEGGAKPPAGK